MNIKKLKELIADLPDSTLVVLSRDSEGNGYSEASGFSTKYLFSEGEIGLAELTDEDKKNGYGNGDLMEDGEQCIVLWP